MIGIAATKQCSDTLLLKLSKVLATEARVKLTLFSFESLLIISVVGSLDRLLVP